MKKIKKHHILIIGAMFFAGVARACTAEYIKLQVESSGLLIKGRSKRLYYVSANEASWSDFLMKKLIEQESSKKIEKVQLDLSDDEMKLLTDLLGVTARTAFDVQSIKDKKNAVFQVTEKATKFFYSWVKSGWRARRFFREEITSISSKSKVTRFINRKKDRFLFHWRRLVFIAHELGIDLLSQLCGSYFVLSGRDFDLQIKKHYESPEFFWHGLGDRIRDLIECGKDNFYQEAQKNRRLYLERERRKKQRKLFSQINTLLDGL